MSAQEYQKFIRQRSGLPSATGPPSAKKPKYHNVKIYIYEDGFVANQKVTGHGKLLRKYDSTKEYRRSEELRLLERAHKISALSEQVPIEISPPFTDSNGKKHSAALNVTLAVKVPERNFPAVLSIKYPKIKNRKEG